MKGERGFAAIGLHRPKSIDNIGATFRAAYCYSASLVVVAGRRIEKSRLDTPKTHRHMPVLHTDSIWDAVPYGAVPVAVDLLPDATPLPRFVHPHSAFYIFGPEDGTLGKAITDRCPHKVYVPTRVCMNLAATVNVILYDRLAKGPRLNLVVEQHGVAA